MDIFWNYKIENLSFVKSCILIYAVCISKGLEEFTGPNKELLPSLETLPVEDPCNKDTGGKKTLRKWSRGHCFIVSGGGHIATWQPLFK